MRATTSGARRILVATITLTVCALGLTVQAHAQNYPVDTGSFESLSPTARAGESISMSGCGFSPGADVAVTIGESSLGTATADATGCFAANFVVRSSVTSGSQEVRATGPSPTATRVLSATLTIAEPAEAGSTSTTAEAPSLLARTGRATLPTVGVAAALGLAGLLVVQLSRRLRTN